MLLRRTTDPHGPCGARRRHGWGFLLAAFVFSPVLIHGGVSSAQVVNDGSVGVNGPGLVANTPNPDFVGGTIFTLGEDDGNLIGGSSLFLSLLQLDLAGGDIARLTGRSSIQNLITRITGGPSSIDGLIRSEIPGADLFLINPDGLIFGENAELDVSGSVVLSTAHEVLFGENGRFDARGLGGDILTVDAPEAFGFLAPPEPIIINASRLQGADEMGLALIGGDLELSGRPGRTGLLAVRSGRIDLASVASEGRVEIQQGPDPDLVLSPGTLRGDITIRDNFAISSGGIARDPLVELFGSDTPPVPGAGPIFVRAHDLTLVESEIRSVTVSDSPGGDISIDLTGDLTLRGEAGGLGASINSGSDLEAENLTGFPVTVEDIDSNEGFIFDRTFCGFDTCGIEYKSGGQAGNIEIDARNVTLEDGGRVSSRSLEGGNAGTITLNLEGDLTIQGRIDGDNRSRLVSNAAGSGNTGTIEANLPNGTLRMDDFGAIVIENGDESISGDSPGRIDIQAAALEMSGNARIDTSTRGEGTGGDIVIDLTGDARLSGADGSGEFTGITSLSRSGSNGPAGTISLTAENVEILDGAAIAARPEDLTSTGDAGSIEIEVANNLLLDGGTISTESATPDGGNVQISAGSLVDLVDSSITSSVTLSTGNGGNIRIQPGPTATRLERSEILAQAQFGDGGSVFIETDFLLSGPNSLISADSQFGQDGTEETFQPLGEANIQQPDLTTPPVEASALLRMPCAARDPGAASSLVFASDPGPIRRDRESPMAPLSTLLLESSRPGDPFASQEALPEFVHANSTSDCEF